MTKVTYKRKHLVGGLLAVPEGEPITIRGGEHGSKQAGRQTDMVLEQYLRTYFRSRAGGRKRGRQTETEWAWHGLL